MGDHGVVYGETVANIHISDSSFPHSVLVTNINENMNLGVDVATRFGYPIGPDERHYYYWQRGNHVLEWERPSSMCNRLDETQLCWYAVRL